MDQLERVMKYLGYMQDHATNAADHNAYYNAWCACYRAMNAPVPTIDAATTNAANLDAYVSAVAGNTPATGLTLAGCATPEDVVKAVYPNARYVNTSSTFVRRETAHRIYSSADAVYSLGSDPDSEAGAWIDAASNILIDQNQDVVDALTRTQYGTKGGK